jgi:hypothetical protein
MALTNIADVAVAVAAAAAVQYKCNPKTGQCRESCPKPNGTPCKGGTCKCGKCIPDPHTCPPQPNACSIYVFNNATMKCDLVNATCQQPPNSCKELRCNPSTGLCTVVVNKPDNTTCEELEALATPLL